MRVGLWVRQQLPWSARRPVGGVDLTLIAYDAAGTVLPLVTNNPLTLMIDTSDLSQAIIDSLQAFDKNGNPVALTGPSTSECPSYHIGPNGYLLLHVTVTDKDPSPGISLNEHLYGYQIDTQFGHGSTSVPTAPAHRGYAQAPATFTPPFTLPVSCTESTLATTRRIPRWSRS